MDRSAGGKLLPELVSKVFDLFFELAYTRIGVVGWG